MRLPDCSSVSPAIATDAWPTESISANTSDRLIDVSSERQGAREPQQARLEERARALPRWTIRADHRLDGTAVERVVDVQARDEPRPSRMDRLVHRQVELVETIAEYRIRCVQG